MRIGIIGENICDIDSVKNFLRSFYEKVSFETKPTRGGIARNLDLRIQELMNRHDDYKAIILLSDLDNKNCKEHLRDLKGAAADNISDLIIIQIVIQKIEAWYLAIPEAIEAAFPNIKPFPRPRGITDSIRNPKSDLKKAFWDKLRKKYNETTDGPKIASRFNYQLGQDYPNKSFQRFIGKISNLNYS